jgi:putative flavoprotein involved in K+ transport
MRSGQGFETVIVGGGQAGLATGYHLARLRRSFVIIDADERIGDSWRRRWDSLRVFTPARYSGLPGWPFPAPRWTYPTKDQVADYLEAYVARFELPVRAGVRVDALSGRRGGYVLTAADERFEADNVVVATGAYGCPNVPAFAAELDPTMLQLNSTQYRNPAQLQAGAALVVGAGNSGAEIAVEVSPGRQTWLSGRHPGSEPTTAGGRVLDRLATPPFWFFLSEVANLRNPIGRKLRPKLTHAAAPLARVKPKHLDAAGVERVPRVVGVRDGAAELEGGRVLEVANVIWCTGFRPAFDWIDLPVFGDDGEPVHERGVVVGRTGLYFVGRPFLYALSSPLIGGVGRDAEYIARHIASRVSAGDQRRAA